jgi:exodeoxyribonuclease V alpha subunit
LSKKSSALNPAGDRKVERFGWTFAPGDKVMQIEKIYDKEVYNGDIGFVTGVEPDEGELTASFDERTVTYSFGELDTLVPAYAQPSTRAKGQNTQRWSAASVPPEPGPPLRHCS